MKNVPLIFPASSCTSHFFSCFFSCLLIYVPPLMFFFHWSRLLWCLHMLSLLFCGVCCTVSLFSFVFNSLLCLTLKKDDFLLLLLLNLFTLIHPLLPLFCFSYSNIRRSTVPKYIHLFLISHDDIIHLLKLQDFIHNALLTKVYPWLWLLSKAMFAVAPLKRLLDWVWGKVILFPNFFIHLVTPQTYFITLFWGGC